MYTGQNTQQPNLQMVYNDPNGYHIYSDNIGNLYRQTEKGLLPCDQNGNIMQQQQAGFRQPMIQQQQYPPATTSTRNRFAATNTNINSFGTSSPKRTEQSFGSNNSIKRSMFNMDYNQSTIDPKNEVSVEDDKMFNLTVRGYKPSPGNEFMPLHDEETEYVQIIVDDVNKTYKFIIKNKE